MGGHSTQAEVQIAAPPARVFDWLLTPDRWVSGMVEFTPLTDPPIGLGSRVHQVIEQGGQRIAIDAEITRLEAPERLEVLQDSPGLFVLTMAHRLAEQDGGTHLVTTLDATLRSRLAKLMAPMITRQVSGKLKGDLERLRWLVEAGP